MLISHDRAFLRALTRATLWIDRGEVSRQDRGFEHFEEWRETVTGRRGRSPATSWTARSRPRPAGRSKGSARASAIRARVRALAALREDASQIRRQGTAAMELDAGQQSGKRVIDAKGISKSFGDRVILKPFDLRVLRGDRVAFVGPNGAGKTTLIKMLTGELAPDTGEVKHGTNLDIAVF